MQIFDQIFEKHRENVAQTFQELRVTQSEQEVIRQHIAQSTERHFKSSVPKFKIALSVYEIYGKIGVFDLLNKVKNERGRFEKLK